jgi:hypothetical protein
MHPSELLYPTLSSQPNGKELLKAWLQTPTRSAGWWANLWFLTVGLRKINSM